MTDNAQRQSGPNYSKRTWLKAGVGTLALGTLTACGFRLRGALPKLPFGQVQFTGSVGLVSEALAKALATQGVQRVDVLSPINPEGDLPSVSGLVIAASFDQRERRVVGSTIAGQVRELNLRVRFAWQALDAAGRALLPPIDITLDQDMSYQESETLSKQLEQDAVYEALQARVVQQVMRRLASIDVTRSAP
ncbi:MAG: hypothetical protein NWS83_01535 [Burkholderiaceae bacterium]|nr:hypothetical protein [Burkholderiaceae bacterium]